MKPRSAKFISIFWLLLSLPFWVAVPYASYFLVAKRDSLTVFVGYKIRVWGSLADFNDLFVYGYPTTAHWTSHTFGIVFTQVSNGTHPYWNLDMSPWPFCLLFTTLATLFMIPSVWRFVRNRHRAAGTCLVCGYDLRASPLRCPECGTESHALTRPPQIL